jgi:hypothetical protein
MTRQGFESVAASLSGRDATKIWLPESDSFLTRMLGMRVDKIAKDATAGFKGEGSILDAINISPETQKKLDAFNKALADLKRLRDEIPDEKDRPFRKDEDFQIGDLTATSIKLPTGFIDFDKANQKIQEALLKGDDVQGDQLNELKKGNDIARNIQGGIKVLQDKIGNAGVAGNIPVATQ